MRFAVYCHDLGWLVDTTFVWSFDVSQCCEFESEQAALEAIEAMVDNGFRQIVTIPKLFCARVR